MTYKLDDGTGTIEVKQWIDSMDVDQAPRHDADGNEISDPKYAFKAGEWCRVWGRIKAFNNRRHVGAHALRPVADKNEISYHLLEATYVHLYLTRGPPEGLAAAAGAATGGAYQAGAPAPQGAYDHSSRQMAGLSVVARKVLQAIRDTPQNNEGLHVQNIAAVMGMPMADVMKGGDELLQQNIIFPTVDDHTWALIE
jgi:replication factor A2